jgi:hypothetical protein
MFATRRATHHETFIAAAMAATVLPFLKDESKPPSWSTQVKQGR